MKFVSDEESRALSYVIPWHVGIPYTSSTHQELPFIQEMWDFPRSERQYLMNCWKSHMKNFEHSLHRKMLRAWRVAQSLINNGLRGDKAKFKELNCGYNLLALFRCSIPFCFTQMGKAFAREGVKVGAL
ncbi:hypothetical protein G9A89_002912 [Geosiphon pyriformis]|nr:hypothetical protein G9A89_002912 [Geosiphon pyriformis]